MKNLSLLVFLFLFGCQSGFYVIKDAPQLSGGQPTSDIKNKYLTTTISLNNNKFVGGELTTGKNKKLSHLYIYAETYNLLLDEQTKIPLLLLKNDDKPSIDYVLSDELLIKYPLDDLYRNKFNFKITSVALEKEKSEQTAQAVFDIAKPYIKQAAVNPAAAAAVNIASQVFEKAYASTEYRYTLTINLKEIYEGTTSSLFLIYPQDRNDSILTVYREESKKEFELRKVNNKYVVFTDDQLYEKLPYILVVHSFDDYFQDGDLFPQNFDPDLTILNEDLITQAEFKLSSLRSSLLTSHQYSYEKFLLSRVQNYWNFKVALENYENNPDSEENIRLLVNSYLSYKSLLLPNTTSNYYKNHYKARIDAVENKIQALFKNKFPHSTIVFNAVDILSQQDMYATNTKEQGEKHLTKLYSIINVVDRVNPESDLYKPLIAIKKSDIYIRAKTEIFALENIIYDQYYQPDVTWLDNKNDCAVEEQTKAIKLSAEIMTNCSLCRKEIKRCLTSYDNRCPSVNYSVSTIEYLEQNSFLSSEYKSLLSANELIIENAFKAEDVAQLKKNFETTEKNFINTLTISKTINSIKLQEIGEITNAHTQFNF